MERDEKAVFGGSEKGLFDLEAVVVELLLNDIGAADLSPSLVLCLLPNIYVVVV